MTDPRITRLAQTLVGYCTGVRPREHVAISGGAAASALIAEVYREVLAAGGYPYVFMAPEGIDRLLYLEGSDDQLRHVSRVDQMVRGEFDCSIGIAAAANTRALTGVDPARLRLRQEAYGPLMETFLRRSSAGEFRWVGTLFPTQAYAQDAEMSLPEFEEFVFGATFCDRSDPAAEWRAVRHDQQRLVDWLAGHKSVVAKGPNIDMSLSIEGRTFVNSDGRHNMPSGEIFTGPVEDSVNGWVRFSYPAISGGREVAGVELTFDAGRVVTARADKNEEYLLSQLDTDAGARYLGEWAIGTNQRIDRFIRNILFDEKIGGTVHMAVGAGYPETGSKNKSAIHWDMICDMRDGGQILVDGELFYESGRFRV
jgi:aminopeptidase